MVTVTLDFTDAMMAGFLSAEVNGTIYKGGYANSTYGKVYEEIVPLGTKIICMVTSNSVYSTKIVVNGITVAQANKTGSSSTTGSATYEYMVVGDATITFRNTTLTITET